METQILRLDEVSDAKDDYVCAIGFFDGVHLGHQALIKEVLKVSREKQLIPAVMTFQTHPLSVLSGLKTTYLTSLEDRLALLEQAGIQKVFLIAFNQEVAALSPAAFIHHYLLPNHIKHVVVGYDFHFGHRNQGSVEDLLSDSFSLSVVAPVMYNEKEKISSTLIKNLLTQGHVRDANRLLSRPFTIRGEVIHGKQRGRLMGYPTANVAYDRYFIPKRGVYGVKVKIGDQLYDGMANIGRNPTFDDILQDSLEIYIFDFDQDIYGEIIDVFFYGFTRPEAVFKSMDELKLRLDADVQEVRALLKEIDQEEV